MKPYEVWLLDMIGVPTWQHVGMTDKFEVLVAVALAQYFHGFAAIGRSGQGFQVYNGQGVRVA